MRKLAIGLLLLLALGAPASAQTISGTYYEDIRQGSCAPSDFFCIVIFPVSPSTAGKLLFVHFVSCSGSINTGVLTSGAIFITDNGANIRRTQPLDVIGQQNFGYFDFRNQLEFKVTGGPPRDIRVSVTYSEITPASLKCSITGEIVTQ